MDRDIPILPEDIVRIIVGFLNPHIVTLLDKKYRDGYFTKYGLSVQELFIYEGNLNSSLLQKYKINLHTPGNGRRYFNEIIYDNNVVKINAMYINDLEYYLGKYPNLAYISGHLEVTSDNLENLRLIKNDLVLYIKSGIELDIVKKYTSITNLISIYYSWGMYNYSLDGLESRVIKAPSYLLRSNTEYPNIKEVRLFNILANYLEKNVKLPRLREITIDRYILNSEKDDIMKKYPDVIISII